ncbi:MAG: hypothetical protein ACPL5I_15875 [Thermodesulfobacteriota bacterium]
MNVGSDRLRKNLIAIYYGGILYLNWAILNRHGAAKPKVDATRSLIGSSPWLVAIDILRKIAQIKFYEI